MQVFNFSDSLEHSQTSDIMVNLGIAETCLSFGEISVGRIVLASSERKEDLIVNEYLLAESLLGIERC